MSKSITNENSPESYLLRKLMEFEVEPISLKESGNQVDVAYAKLANSISDALIEARAFSEAVQSTPRYWSTLKFKIKDVIEGIIETKTNLEVVGSMIKKLAS